MKMTLIVIDIVTESPWAVASPERAEAADLPVATDAYGSPYVPASSLAGSLRDHLRRHDQDTALMGSRPPTLGDQHPAAGDSIDGEGDGLTPSRLRLLGTELTAGDVFLYQQTAVDRRTGAAADKMLRSTQLLPAGSRIRLFIRSGGELGHETLDLLAGWRPYIGRGRSAGLGRARVACLRWGRLDMDDADDLKRWITLGGPALFAEVCTQVITPPDVSRPEDCVLHAQMRVVDGMLAAGEKQREGDRERTVPHRRDGDYVIPGSSLRGVFRSRTEFILRSLGVEVCDGTAACGESSCPVCEVFGSSERASRLMFTDAVIGPSPGGAPELQERAHVAIDRITGGARAGLLFSESVLVRGAFNITIHATEALPTWVIPLLLHILADLDDGLIGLGGRVRRGLGTVKLVGDSEPPLAERLQPSAIAQLNELIENGRPAHG